MLYYFTLNGRRSTSKAMSRRLDYRKDMPGQEEEGRGPFTFFNHVRKYRE